MGTSTPGTASTLTYRPQLDGLRAVAVAAVAWSHWERSYQFGLPFGAGVHLFYVLSGFLITGILVDLRTLVARGAAMRAFYVRRALRIFPAFYLTLALAWWGDVPLARDTIAWHASYLSNVLIFRTGDWQGSLSHLWSLAVEEQFYLIWPWVILFVPRAWLLPSIVAAIAVAPLFRWTLASVAYRENMLAVLMPGSLDSLALGALLAVAPSRWRERMPRAGGVALLGWLLVHAGGAYLPLWVTALKQTLQGVVFAWMVWGAAVGIGGMTGRLLSAAPVVYLGKISYGIYLVHGFAGELLASVGVSSRALPEPLRFAVLAAVTVGVASLSWHLMERPVNALKRRVPYAAAARGESPHPSPVGSAS